jgi:hypothetical protein
MDDDRLGIVDLVIELLRTGSDRRPEVLSGSGCGGETYTS